MKILRTLNEISWKKLISLTFIIAILLAIPVSVFVVQQQTRLSSKAYFPKPEPIIPTKQYGLPSQGEPEITLVWPFLGKVGDSVLIEGVNLGENPISKALFVSNVPVPEEDILRWTPTLIEFVLPQSSLSGLIRLEVAGKTAAWSFPFTVYNLETKIQVTENNYILRVINPPAGDNVKIKIYYANGEVMESNQFKNINLATDKKIISVEIIDNNLNSLPFFVEPEEFGF